MSNAIEILDSEWHAIDLGRVTLVPRNWEAQATGGPTVATIDGTGDIHALWGATLWLGYHVRIRNNSRYARMVGADYCGHGAHHQALR
jgi:hypothetical protein